MQNDNALLIEDEDKTNVVKPVVKPNVSDQIPKRKGDEDYSEVAISERVQWLEQATNTSLKHIPRFSSDPLRFKGNIENIIGTAQVPIGIAGPLKINGEYANGVFYVPMATTEGVLITSFSLGMKIITRCGGVDVKLLRDALHVTSLFPMTGLNQANMFIKYINKNSVAIKNQAELTTNHGSLKEIETIISGQGVLLRFIYDTKDAMGMNMINLATKKACEFISQELDIKKYYIRSNFSADKKMSFFNIYKGYGKDLFASATITKECLRLLRVTPQQIFEFYINSSASSLKAGMIGFNGQIVNGITSIFIACGQDVAHIVHSANSVSAVSITPTGDLYISVNIPNLLVGTVGGGTAIGTQRECLDILGCYGSGKVKKFAEIIAATVLAGELSICAALTSGKFFDAHEKYGRNKPNILD
ncbi:MAG: hydroxymethylglutaryl-CoA reductase (NADPH) [Parcubacteria group bacterium Athens1014_10]|nr:MAG: hydroxymethylglutaryl-CoA reductase (NADPH) [Parcubacteria group bacterium Athens1014_10]TSD04492.1 MAG: hydroxymethylglutaryl-CoA reductase (NADPH) [Parcubacteria group bacterium Athens0714_12]